MADWIIKEGKASARLGVCLINAKSQILNSFLL